MDEKKPTSLIPSRGGMLRDVIDRMKLIGRLIADRRINPFLKLIPIGAIVYLIMPVDLAPGIALPVIGALDDAAVLWLGSYLFVEFCPPNVVEEHMKALSSNMKAKDVEGDVVDGETTDISDETK